MNDRGLVARRAADRLIMHARTLTEPRWKPLPHQVPPPIVSGGGWLLLAGRGAGKTDACAKYVHDHVYGPPCMPGKTPHWIGIIAPTLGDAATSCVTGPSGLYAHSPEAKMVSAPGGTVVRWPNGSEAKLFGAHTPEDVERLRSGGNRCAAEGTLVQTEYGERPVETIRPGDRVWTRSGLRTVLHVWDNGEREVHRYDHAAGSTWLTPDHEVFTRRGWKQVSSVTTTDTVFTWADTSSTTGSAGTPASETLTTGTAAGAYCTGGCGSRKWGTYRPGCMCITRTTTNGTTGSATSSSCCPVSTGTSTEKSAAPTGIARAAGRPGPRHSPGILRASGAVQSSVPGPRPEPGTALRHAATLLLRHEHGNDGCAACAAGSSSASAGPRRAHVHAGALQSSPTVRVARVYDLTVEHDHEFFADGLLVSNCLQWLEELAAWRYLDAAWPQMRFGLRQGPKPHWVASTTPKPRELIKRLASGRVRDTAISRASMYDNPHLPEEIRNALEEEYAGTQLGRQELLAEIIDQDENALWNREMLDACRLPKGSEPKMIRRSVGVDPSGGAGEQGIVVVGKGMIPREHEDIRKRVPLAHGYVLADRTCHLKPEQWGRRAVQAAVDWQADDICVETNFGGDMALHTIRAAADAMGINVPIKKVVASRGKRVRAEPVSAITEQGRWHMVGNFPQLEDQYCTWYPELDWSPDRLDASVWPAHHMRVVKSQMTGDNAPGGMSAMSTPIG